MTKKRSDSGHWLLLIHQLPPKPDYFRVKIWRRLQAIGAVAIKNSVYVLPFNDEAMEDFQWLRREITAGGGEATVCRASFVDGMSDRRMEALFRPLVDHAAASQRPAAGRVFQNSERASFGDRRRVRDLSRARHAKARGSRCARDTRTLMPRMRRSTRAREDARRQPLPQPSPACGGGLGEGARCAADDEIRGFSTKNL